MKCVEISASACISDWWGIEGIILTQWRYSVKDINQISVTFYCWCPIIFSITSAVMLVRPYDASFKTLSFRDFCILSSFFFVFYTIHHQHLFLLFTHSLVWVHLFGTYCFLIVLSVCHQVRGWTNPLDFLSKTFPVICGSCLTTALVMIYTLGAALLNNEQTVL